MGIIWKCLPLIGTLFLAACDELGQLGQSSETTKPADVETFQIGITSGLSRLPWSIARRSGAIDAIEQHERLRLNFVRFANEADAVEAYAAGQIDGVTSTLNTVIGTLETNARDTHVVLLTDFSRGAHGILSRRVQSPSDLAGKRVHVQHNTASHYLLFRALERYNMAIDDVELIDTSASALLQGAIDNEIETLVAGAPLLGQLRGLPELREIMTSEQLASEMVGGVMVDGPTLSENPKLGDALVDVWFAAIAHLMADHTTFTQAGLNDISKLSGLSIEVVKDLLHPRDLISDPEQSLILMDGTNLNTAIFGGQRFRTAVGEHLCTKADPRACLFTREGDVIENGVGTRLVLDKQYLERFAESTFDAR